MSSVTRPVIILLVLCGLMTACNPSDTDAPKEWRRTTEAWLSGNPQWQPCPTRPLDGDRVVQQACDVTSANKQGCDELVKRHEQARQLLTESSECTSEAIEALSRFAPTIPEAKNDLAAAYYVRAQREDDPVDLLRALEAVEKAPVSAASQFNRALIFEELGFYKEAFAAWEGALRLDSRSQWAAEARKHRDALRPIAEADAERRWECAQVRIEEALLSGDDAALKALVAQWPAAVYEWVRDVLLLQDRIADARRVAKVLYGATDDRSAVDLVNGNGNPTRIRAAIDEAASLSRDGHQAAAYARLMAVAPDVRKQRYPLLQARFDLVRGYVLYQRCEYSQALKAYRAALDPYKRANDREGLANAYTRTAGIYVLMGSNEQALRDAINALRNGVQLRDATRWHAMMGEVSSTVNALNSERLALAVQNDIVSRMRTELRRHPKKREATLNLAIALRARAGLELADNPAKAARDLQDAAALLPHNKSMQARIADVRAQLVLKTDKQKAIEEFTRSLKLAGDQDPTFRARLYAQRANAHLTVGNRKSAITDLQLAIQELNKEEQLNLAGRDVSEGEELWPAYFERFRDTYDQLITEMIEDRDAATAFYYNEQSRSADPLNLILQSDPKLAGARRDLPSIQAALPDDTVILQYAVLRDVTYVWMISRRSFEFTSLPVGRERVERWTKTLQTHARMSNVEGFDANLQAPYAELFEKPLNIINREQPRLVIIPDGPMHGLPFAALRTAQPDHYFVQDATIEVAASTALYLMSLERDRQLRRDDSSILLVGNPAFDRASAMFKDLPALPSAVDEVKEIRELYGDPDDPLVGREATRGAFVSRAMRPHSYIHIAAHAIANPDAPHHSYLVFADGVVDAKQLLTLKLDQTRLVVLGACGSVGGQPVGLQGVAPLVRPLIGKGVPAVLGTLWNVNDATTSQLLVSFHQHYTNGEDAATALQAAQREFLNSKKAIKKPPLVWGSFQVIGHASAPLMNRRKPP